MSAPSGLTLGAFPYYPNNPWQDLVYADLRSAGVQVIPLDDIRDTAWAEQALERGDSCALHINWTAPITQVGSIADSYARVDGAMAALTRLDELGVATVWTVHNVLPHDAHHLLPEVALCRFLASRADLITVLNPATQDAVLPWYRLPPEKTRELTPPSYLATYADDVTRVAARARFGIAESEQTLLLLGTLRPYKGIAEAVAAMAEVRRSRPGTRLLIAGEIGPGYDEATLMDLVSGVPGVELHIGYVPESEMQWWMRAADAMLLPYRAGLNSGVMMMAAGFGLPVIMTAGEASLGYADAEWVHVVDDRDSLAAGILAGLTSFESGAPAATALATAQEHDPQRISRLFSRFVRTVTDRKRARRA